MLLLAALASGLAGAQSLPSLPVDGMVWELQRLVDDGQSVNFPASLGNPSVAFDAKASAGTAGCNTYRAPYASRQDLLRFGQISTTRMACAAPRMALEAQFLRLLKSTGRYTIAGNVLTLYSGSSDLLVFRQRSGAKPVQPGQPSPVQPGITTPNTSAPVAPAPVLNGVSWRLLTLNGQTPKTTVAVSLKVDVARLGGSDGCNSFGSEAKTDETTIRATSPIVQTEMACVTSSADKVPSLPALLQRGATYRISGHTLTLTGDGNTWVFTALVTTQTTPPVVPPLPSAVTIFDRSSAADLGPDEDLYIVGPQQQNCTGVAAQRCLIVKQPGETAWKLFYGQIEGFTFRPGVISLLRVRVERVATPQADGSNVRYRLVRVLGTQLVR